MVDSTVEAPPSNGSGATGASAPEVESAKLGGVRYTSREALMRFFAALNEPDSVPAPPARSAELAGEQLTAKGA